ncbi:MAG: DEAD/DEAH box helicase [Euryarchaeota archaeon]|nr:DEAD/DEAH box helicase [Euryarchaeota archaeon]
MVEEETDVDGPFAPAVAYSEMDLSWEMKKALQTMGYEHPTEIQAKVIPVILSGRDVMAQAQTGTGKTAAFGIPLVERLPPHSKDVCALALVPTRELAEQVAEEITELGHVKGVRTLAVYGGASMNRQVQELSKGVEVVVGTPGRIMDHMRRQTLHFRKLQFLVLDEADRMLDMGFIDDINWIMRHIPKGIQTLLFSATIPGPIEAIARRYMKDPETVRVAAKKLTLDTTEQIYFEVGYKNKVWALYRVLEAEKPELAMVFCRTKREVDKVVKLLRSHGYDCEPLHGDMPQGARTRVMESVRTGKVKVLITTNVAARGIDVLHTSHVINYDMPEDPEWYVHRIGRTGRAGRTGKAITFVTNDERGLLSQIESASGSKVKLRKVPESAGGRDRIRRIDDFNEFASPIGVVRFRLDVGKRDGVVMMGLLRELASRARVRDSDFGLIQVHEAFSELELPQRVAGEVYRAVNGKQLYGKVVEMRPIRE